MTADSSFSVSEIFHSIQGEGRRAGLPCVFVRLQGCSLRCTWCDTGYALSFEGGRNLTRTEILAEVASYECPFVEVTGGEPLEQEGGMDLIAALCEEGYDVAVETGGHVSVEGMDVRVSIIMDVKCPGSGMDGMNRLENLQLLTGKDEVKFVLSDVEDYLWARDLIQEQRITAGILFSPAFGLLDPRELAEWILRDRLPVRMQLQMHKYIWDPDQRGV